MPTSATTPAPLAAARSARWQAGLLIGLGLVAFWNGVQGQFVLDDMASLIDHPQTYHIWPWGRIDDFNRWFGVWTFQWSYAIGGHNPATYHLANIAIHLAAGLTLWALVRRCLRLPGTPPWLCEAAEPLALASAALWLVHPLQTQSVTYIVQRYESLMGLCFLLTLYCTLRGACAGRSWPWYLGATLCAWLGAGTKEVMVVCPLVLLLFDRCFLADSWREVWRRRWGLHAAVALAAVWLVVAVRSLAAAGAFSATSDFAPRGLPSAWEYLRSQPAVLLYYLRLSFWPDVLVLDRGWPIEHSPWRIFGLGAVILLLLGASLIAIWRRPRLGFLGLAFFLILAPTSSVMPIADLAFEHRMYLPLAPVVILTVVGVWYLLTRLPFEEKRRRLVGGLLLLLVVAPLTARSIARNDDYAHPDRLLANNTLHAPHHARPYRCLAYYLRMHGRAEEAKGVLRAALDLDPSDFRSWIDLGSLYYQTNDFDTALELFRHGLSVNPKAALGHANIARVLMLRGDYAGAIGETRQAVLTEPRNRVFVQQLAWLLATAPDEGLRNGQEALTLLEGVRTSARRPDVRQHSVRAAALAELGRFDEAVIDASRALAAAETIRSQRAAELREQLANYQAGKPWRLSNVAGTLRVPPFRSDAERSMSDGTRSVPATIAATPPTLVP